jgi:CrcB protein
MKLFVQYMAIGAAGFFGSIARFAVARCIMRWFPITFPLGTFVINISGSFFLGWFFTLVGQRYPISDTMKLAIGVGFVGAYTTFSTFMCETDALLTDKLWTAAMINLVGSLVLGLAAVRLGIVLGRRF